MENARLIARNIYAKYSGCTRREAMRVLMEVSDEDCRALADMTPEDASQSVRASMVESARRIVSDAAKQPSADAKAGLSGPAEAATDVHVDEEDSIYEEMTDGKSESGLNPS